MCVVSLVEFDRPSSEQVGWMWDQNNKGGGGVAWRAVNDDGREVVRWRKGLSKQEMQDLNETLPMPYVLHFRQPSHDTSASPLACHPFQIDDDATTGFAGEIEGYVLFHNGFWAGWRTKLEQMALSGHCRLPSGAWSDTRGLAWAAHHLGFGFLEMVNEKVLAFGPGELDIEMFGGPWLNAPVPGSEKGIIVSNRVWEKSVGFSITDRRRTTAQDTTSKLLTAASDAIVPKAGESRGTSQPTPFRRADGRTTGDAGAEGNLEKSLQKDDESTISGDVGSRTSGLEGPLKNTCGGCGKHTNVGNEINKVFFCYQCWSKQDITGGNDIETHSSEWDRIGRCQTCKVTHSAMQTDDQHWICMTCWETNGRPKITFMRAA